MRLIASAVTTVLCCPNNRKRVKEHKPLLEVCGWYDHFLQGLFVSDWVPLRRRLQRFAAYCFDVSRCKRCLGPYVVLLNRSARFDFVGSWETTRIAPAEFFL